MNELSFQDLVRITKRREKAVLDSKNNNRLVKDIQEEILKDFGIENPTERQLGIIQGFIMCYYNYNEIDFNQIKKECKA